MIVDISIDELRKLLGKEIELDEIVSALDSYGTPVDEIVEEDGIIRVEVFPNRMDMLSITGVARALSQYLEIKPGIRTYPIEDADFSIVIEGKLSRPYLSFAAVKGVELDEELLRSIMQMQEKVHFTYGRDRRKYSIGLYDLDKIEPPIIVKEMRLEDISFVPLGFKEELDGKEILELTEKGKKYRNLVSEDRAMVFLDSTGKILSMPPIINGEDTKVTEKTKNILIDSTGTAEGTSDIVEVFAANLAEVGRTILKVYNVKFVNKTVEVNLRKLSKFLGREITEETAKRALSRMGLKYDGAAVTVPFYRKDILSWQDLAEEIAIGLGYNTFEPSLPAHPLLGMADKFAEFREKVQEILVGMGYLEVRTFLLTSPDLFIEQNLVEVVESKSRETSVLRPRLLPGIIQILSMNKNEPYPQKLFEIGRVYVNGKEEWHLAMVMASKDASFSKIYAEVLYLFRVLGVEPNFKDSSDPYFIDGRCGEGWAGKFGEVIPELASRVEMPVAAAEFNLEEIFKRLRGGPNV